MSCIDQFFSFSEEDDRKQREYAVHVSLDACTLSDASATPPSNHPDASAADVVQAGKNKSRKARSTPFNTVDSEDEKSDEKSDDKLALNNKKPNAADGVQCGRGKKNARKPRVKKAADSDNEDSDNASASKYPSKSSLAEADHREARGNKRSTKPQAADDSNGERLDDGERARRKKNEGGKLRDKDMSDSDEETAPGSKQVRSEYCKAFRSR